MKYIFLAIVILLAPAAAMAVDITATNTAVVTPPHKVGDCVTMLGGQWQQLSDGTWASPNDQVNTCASGANSGWNFGMIPGLGALSGLGGNSTLSSLTGIAALLALNNNQSNLGNQSTGQLATSLLAQSLLANQSNSLLGTSSLLNGVGTSGLTGLLGNSLLYPQLGLATNSSTFYGGNGAYNIAVGVPSTNQGLTKVLSIASMGWSLSHLF